MAGRTAATTREDRMTDPSPDRQPTEEELRDYLEQLREADAAQVLVQAYQLLGTGAEVKLGRPDARVLIDAMGGLAEAASRALPAELVGQLREGVRQLQLAQVQAESKAGPGGQPDAGPEATPPAGQPRASDPAPPAPPGGQPGQPGQPGRAGARPGQPQEQKATDRLWIPGRGAPGVQ